VKIYVVCDIEGVAGVIDHRQQCWFDGPYYAQARRLATLELNALVEGALEGGATDIVAWDGHGPFPGGLDVELLHPECRLVMGAGGGGPVGLDDSYDALFQCGLHAMAGTAGAVMAHGGWRLNGRPLGEIGMNGLTAGMCGVPCVFISGDEAAALEARALVPDIEVVVVKQALLADVAGLSPAPALSLAPEKACQVIREGARRAMGRVGSIPPLRFEPPYTLEWQFSEAQAADEMAARPGAIRVDATTVAFESDAFFELPL